MTCPGCLDAATHAARASSPAICRECGSTLTPDAAGEAKGPRRRNARAEIGAIARAGVFAPAAAQISAVAGDGNRNGGPALGALSAHERWLDSHGRSLELAQAAVARLHTMRMHGGDGARYADACLYAYGSRGSVLNSWESLAAAIAERYGREGEQAAHLAAMPLKKRAKLTEAMATIAYGNVLLDRATRAYERDEWESLPTHAPPVDAPERRTRAIVARWEQARVAIDAGVASVLKRRRKTTET